jgi:hypothetical protein
MPPVRMKIHLTGGFSTGPGIGTHNLRRGDVVEVSDEIAAQWLEHGYAELRTTGEIGPAYKPEATPNW